MQSDDKECVLMYGIPVAYLVNKPFLVSVNKLLGRHPGCSDQAFYCGRKLFHLNQLMNELSEMLGTRDFNMDDYVSVFTKEKAKKWFNADSVHIFDVTTVKPLDILDRKYIYCTRIDISKKNRPFMMLTLFFTDDGKNIELEYLSKLEKNVWYKKSIWTWRTNNRWMKLTRRDFKSSSQ